MMAHLYPNMLKEQYTGSEDYIYAAPIPRDEWERLRYHSHTTGTTARPHWIRTSYNHMSHVTFAPPYVTLILREPQHTDDQMLEAAAWLRITLGSQDRMYVVPYTNSVVMAEAAAMTAGAPKHLSIGVAPPPPPTLGDDDELETS